MTTLTTVLAMVTMLFSQDVGSDMSKGMAIVIIGGLTYATLMTLFIVPVMYDLFYRKPPGEPLTWATMAWTSCPMTPPNLRQSLPPRRAVQPSLPPTPKRNPLLRPPCCPRRRMRNDP